MASADHPEPEQLLEVARQGDTQAQGQLFELYRRYLGLLAQLQIDERFQAKIDASDLVQETFLETHRDFASFRGTSERELMNWLRQILVRNLADRLHRYYGAERRDVQLERSLHGEVDRSSQALDRGLVLAGTTPSQSAARREQAVLLADALARLSDEYREVLVLRYFKGLKFNQVARKMGRSLESVKKLHIRALARLRQAIGGDS